MALKKKIKILILVDWFYPGYKAGGQIQSCRNLVDTMQEDFELYVITSDRDLGDTKPYEQTTVNAWNDYSPFTKVFYTSALSLQQLYQLQQRIAPDYIYLNSMYSWRFTILPLWLLYTKRIKAKLVLAPRGMLHAGALRFKSKKKQLFLRLIKASGIEKKNYFSCNG